MNPLPMMLTYRCRLQVFFLMAFALMHTLIAQSSGPNWQSIGPSYAPGGEAGVGSVTCIAFHPQNASIYWIGTPGGGLWQTTNNGTAWFTNTDNAPFKGVSSIIVDHSNPNRLFIATGDTKDGGMFRINGIRSPDSECKGIYVSTNAGITFSASGLNTAPLNPDKIYKLIQHPQIPNILFAATSLGIYRSQNFGALWQLAQAGDFSDITYNPADSAQWYATGINLTGGASFWFSADDGVSWVQNQYFSNVGRIALAVIPATGEVHLLCSNSLNQGAQSFHGLYRSQRPDSSDTFQPYLTAPNVLGWSTTGSGTSGMGLYSLSFTADPNDSTFLYIGCVNIWRVNLQQNTLTCMSSHQGGTQNPGNLSVVHAGQHQLAFAPGSPSRLLVCNDGGVYRSNNQAFSWQELTHAGNSPVISQVLRIASHDAYDDLLIAGLHENGTRMRNSSGWKNLMQGYGVTAEIDPADTAWCYIASPGGPIFRSSNGGNTFTTNIYNNITGAPQGSDLSPFFIHPHRQFQILTGIQTIFHSADRGDSWQAAVFIPGINQPLRALYMPEADTQVLYACNFARMYRTSDKGQSWTDITPAGLSGNITGITGNPELPDDCWISIASASGGSGVLHTSNAGAVWNDISGTLPDVPVNVIRFVEGSNDAVYIGTAAGVYYRDATLNDWIAFQSGLPVMPVMDLNILYRSKKVRAATYGRGVWESDWPSAMAGVPVVQFSVSDSVVCEGASIQFQDISTANPQQWSWFFPGGNPQISTVSNPTVTYQQEGTYSVILRVQNTQGENAVVRKALIRVGKAPLVQPSYSGPVCEGAQFQLQHPDLIGCSYVWQGPNNFTSVLRQPLIPNATQNTAGVYSLLIAYPGCNPVQGTLSVSVFPIPLPPLSITNNSPICAGQSLQLTVQLPTGVSARWLGPQSFASTNTTPLLNNAQVNNSGTYSVFSVASGCESQPITTQVMIHPLPAKPIITANGNILTSSATAGNQWYLNLIPLAGETQSALDVGLYGLGAYTVQVTSDSGCQSFMSDTRTITVLNTVKEAAQLPFTLYPNPASDRIYLNLHTQYTGELQLTLLDAQGKVLRRYTVEAQQLITLSVQDVPRGLYFLRVEIPNVSAQYLPCSILH
jgi:PKD repeat protein